MVAYIRGPPGKKQTITNVHIELLTAFFLAQPIPIDRQTDGPTDRPTNEPIDRPIDGPTDRQTDGPKDGPIDRPTDR